MKIQAIGAARTMSTREIAELVNSTHDSVLKTTRRLIAEGVVFGNETLYTHPQNSQQYPEILMDFRNSLVVASGYSSDLRARVIDRWQELERSAAPALPQTFSAALRLAAEQAEQIEQQAAALALAAPKVEFVERYVDATGTQGFREVCKLLGAKEPAFRAFLAASEILYKLGGAWVPYSQHIDAGRFVVKTGSADNGHAFSSARFTARGVEWVAGEWAKHQIRSEVAA